MRPANHLSTTLLATLFCIVIGSGVLAETRPWNGESMLDDPEWRRSFLGSYGFLSGAEPDVAPRELEILRDVLDLMKANPRAATAMLAQQTNGDSSAALDFILANLYFQNEQLDLAVERYESALEKFPDFRRAHKNLGLLHIQQVRLPEALSYLSRAIELGDRDGRSYGLLGYAHLSQGNSLAADVAYRNAILAQPEVRDWKLGLARSLLALEKYEEAVALFGELIEEEPKDPKVWLLQANAYLGQDKPLEAAVNLEAVRLVGKAETSSLVLLGDIYMNAGMPQLAAGAYAEVIERDAGRAEFETAHRAADLLMRTGSFNEAKGILRSIDAQYGEKLTRDQDLEVLTLKARLARSQGRENEAAKLLESIVKRDGTRGDALLELASHYQQNGQHEKAILLAERAERLDAYERKALLARAQFLVAEREYTTAAQLLRKALQIRTEPRVERFLAQVEQASRS